MKLADYIAKSTMKREFAAAAFFLWYFWGMYLQGRLPTTQIAPDAALSAWTSMEPYMFSLVTLAFGADFVAKQTNIAGPPQQSDDAAGLKVEVAPQDVKVDGVLKGTINMDQPEDQKANG